MFTDRPIFANPASNTCVALGLAQHPRMFLGLLSHGTQRWVSFVALTVRFNQMHRAVAFVMSRARRLRRPLVGPQRFGLFVHF